MALELGTAYITILPETSKLATALRKGFADTEKVSKQSGEKSGGLFSGGLSSKVGGALTTGLKVAAVSAGATVTATLGASLIKGFGRLTAIDDARGKLLGLGNTAKTVDTIMADALASVKGTAYGLDAAATTAAGAVASGIKPGKELQSVLTLVADAATIGGTSMGEMGAIFNKVAASGKVQGDVLAQLGDKGIPIVQFLSKELGVSAEETVKLASKGKINFAQFAAAMKTGLGGAAKESGKTFSGALANTGAALGRIGANLLSGVFPKLSGALTTLTEWMAPLEDLAKIIGDSIGDAVSSAAGWLTQFNTASDGTDGFLTSLTDAFSSFGQTAKDAFNAIMGSPFVQWLAQLAAEVVSVLLPAFANIGRSIVSDLLPALMSAGRAIGQVVLAIMNSPITGFILAVLKPVIMGFVDGVVRVLRGLVTFLTGLFNVIAGLLTGNWSQAWDGLKGIVVGAINVVVGALQTGLLGRALAALRMFGGVVGTVAGAVGAVFTRVLPAALRGFSAWILNAFGPVIAWFQVVIPAALGVLKTAWSATWDALSAAFSAVSQAWSVAWDAMGVAFSAVWSVIQAIAVTAWNILVNTVMGPIRFFVGTVLPAAIKIFSGLWMVAWGLIQIVATVAWALIEAVVVKPLAWWFGTVIPAALNVAKNVFTAVWNGIYTAVNFVWVRLLNIVLKPLAEWFTRVIVGTLITLRSWFMTVWNAIYTAVNFVWNLIVTYVLKPLVNWFTRVIVGTLITLRSWFTTVWNAVLAVVTTVWNRIVIGPLTAVRNWFTVTLPAALNVLRSWFATAWNAILSVITTVWNAINSRVFTPLRNWLTVTLPAAFTKIKDVATAAWNVIRDALSAGWKWISSNVFAPFTSRLGKLGEYFDTVIAGIKKTWEGLKEIVAAPVRFVVNDIIRDKLAGSWNAVASRLNLPTWDFPGWARGGWTGPGSMMQPAGVVHADEFVIRKKSQRKLRREQPGLLDHLNRYGQLPMPGYAPGGLVYQSMAAWVRKNLPGVAITSSYRPGAYTASGNQSYHARGMALDISPSMAAFDKIRATFGGSIAELIFTPAGGRQVKNGRPLAYWGPAVAAMHYNHVHWAMRNMVGGVPLDAGDGTVGGGFSIANPIAATLKALISPLFGGARRLIDGLVGMFGDNDATSLAKAFAKKPVDSMETWLKEKIDALFPAMFGDSPGAPGDGLDGPPLTGSVRAVVQKAAAERGWGAGANWDALNFIIGRESGWNPNAKNPTSTAYGLFQFLDSTWRSVGATKSADPSMQSRAGMAYIKQRYGNPVAARAFWQRNGWYAEGGLVDHVETMDSGGLLRPGVSLVHNWTGRPETVRTWEQERQLGVGGGTRITINGIKHDSVGEFASELNFALTRAAGRSRYAEAA